MGKNTDKLKKKGYKIIKIKKEYAVVRKIAKKKRMKIGKKNVFYSIYDISKLGIIFSIILLVICVGIEMLKFDTDLHNVFALIATVLFVLSYLAFFIFSTYYIVKKMIFSMTVYT